MTQDKITSVMRFYTKYFFYCHNVGIDIRITPIIRKAFNKSLYSNKHEQIILWNIRNNTVYTDFSRTVLQIVHE